MNRAQGAARNQEANQRREHRHQRDAKRENHLEHPQRLPHRIARRCNADADALVADGHQRRIQQQIFLVAAPDARVFVFLYRFAVKEGNVLPKRRQFAAVFLHDEIGDAGLDRRLVLENQLSLLMFHLRRQLFQCQRQIFAEHGVQVALRREI